LWTATAGRKSKESCAGPAVENKAGLYRLVGRIGNVGNGEILMVIGIPTNAAEHQADRPYARSIKPIESGHWGWESVGGVLQWIKIVNRGREMEVNWRRTDGIARRIPVKKKIVGAHHGARADGSGVGGKVGDITSRHRLGINAQAYWQVNAHILDIVIWCQLTETESVLVRIEDEVSHPRVRVAGGLCEIRSTGGCGGEDGDGKFGIGKGVA
jgi:hypothetical protein